MRKNPIVDVVHDILTRADSSMSEYELLQQVKTREPVFIARLEKNDKLALFQVNFMVMNALYQLQVDLFSRNVYVSIAPLDIQMKAIHQNDSQALMSNLGEQKLRAYYLDWRNLTDTNEDDVEKLLTSFWKMYVAKDKQVEALRNLDLPLDADWEKVKQQYRRLVGIHHPDKGGDSNEFKKIRKAYEALQLCQLDLGGPV